MHKPLSVIVMKSGEKILESLRVQKELEKQLAFDFARLDKKRPYRAEFEHKGYRLCLEIEDFDRMIVSR